MIEKTPGCAILSEHDAMEVHVKALEILERTGVKVYHDGARELLRKAGARVDGESVFIREHLVKKTLDLTPSQVLIYDREGKVAMRLFGRNNYFGGGSDTPNVIDYLTGERRLCLERDVNEAARLTEYLPHLDFSMSLGLISDRPTSLHDVYQFKAQMCNTKKPIIFTSHHVQNTKLILDIASAIAGGKQELYERPFIINYLEPSTPLRHTEEAVDKLLFHAEEQLPALYASGPIAGAMAPITPAAAVTIAWAENLSGNVIAQLWNEGTPIVFGSSFSVMDMRHTVLRHAAPAAYFMNAAFNEVCRYFNVPCFTVGGCSDSKLADMQAAIEYMISLIAASISGGNLIHDLGYLESGLTSSLKMLCYANLGVEMLKRFNLRTASNDSYFNMPDSAASEALNMAEKSIWHRLVEEARGEDEAVKKLIQEAITEPKAALAHDYEEQIDHIIEKETQQRGGEV